jgi:hypothetical protein
MSRSFSSPLRGRSGDIEHDAVVDKFADACARFSFERDGVLLSVSFMYICILYHCNRIIILIIHYTGI